MNAVEREVTFHVGRAVKGKKQVRGGAAKKPKDKVPRIARLETPAGKKLSRKFIVEDGEKVYLDQRRHVSRLSSKAEHIQDVLAGIATAAGGDQPLVRRPVSRLRGLAARWRQIDSGSQASRAKCCDQ